jgi:hypothetical protein
MEGIEMAGNGYWEMKTYRSGMIGEKVKYFVPYARNRKQERSTPAKIIANANNVTRKVNRILCDNFTGLDYWVTLTYDQVGYQRVLDRAKEMDAGMSEEDRIWLAAAKELELAMDRARRKLHKEGIELRYFAITSDMDGETGEMVRVHHHVVVRAECVAALMDKWPWGDGHAPDHLWDMDDYSPLAEYMMKQVRYIKDAKKYVPSRNLIRTPAKTPRRCLSGARLRPPKGCKLLYADPYTGERDCQYIRYLLPPEQWTGARNENNDGGVSRHGKARAPARDNNMQTRKAEPPNKRKGG